MTIKLDAIRQREQAATEGPWEAYHDAVLTVADIPFKETVCHGSFDTDDATFIAASRVDVPLLLAVVDAARLVSQWADNVAEWPVPPPLNEELRVLRAALAPLLEPEG